MLVHRYSLAAFQEYILDFVQTTLCSKNPALRSVMLRDSDKILYLRVGFRRIQIRHGKKVHTLRLVYAKNFPPTPFPIADLLWQPYCCISAES